MTTASTALLARVFVTARLYGVVHGAGARVKHLFRVLSPNERSGVAAALVEGRFYCREKCHGARRESMGRIARIASPGRLDFGNAAGPNLWRIGADRCGADRSANQINR